MGIIDRYFWKQRIHYVFFWIFLGILYFLVFLLLMLIYSETALLWTFLIITLMGLTLVPIIATHASFLFKELLKKLESILIIPIDNKNLWFIEKTREIFSFDTFFSKLFSIFICILLSIFLLTLNLPIQNRQLKYLFIILLQPIFISGSRAGFIAIALLRFLTNAVKYPTKSPFYKPKDLVILPLTDFYSRVAIIALALYLLSLLAIILSSFIYSTQMIVWIIFSGFFPLALFIFSFFQIRNLVKRIKNFHVERINEQIQSIYDNLNREPSKENAETLNQFMEIQNKVEKIQEWPLSFNGLVTLIVTFLIPVAQLVISIVYRNP